jgi:3-deoxy-manno-octulosonate cytidylyltransferase (CMP-KDO synthetase)
MGPVVVVIPARYASSRFPGKPLAPIAGKPMIQRVYEQARRASSVNEVLVATDHPGIQQTVLGFGGRVALTSPDHASGTDRIAEAIAGTDAELVINVQGDEPLMPPVVIDRLVQAMRQTQAEMGTVAVPLCLTAREFTDPNVVKVVIDAHGYALYFSRAPIPFRRADASPVSALWHWGLYAYRRSFLDTFVHWPRGRLESCESLEQLRALENGARIFVLVQEGLQSAGVDVPADVARVEAILRSRGEA